MTTQEQAFRTYYSSMADDELLRNVANRKSYLDLAQTLMVEEAAKRRLAIPVEARPGAQALPAGAPSRVAKAFSRLFSTR